MRSIVSDDHVGSIEPDEQIGSGTVLDFPFEAVDSDADGGTFFGFGEVFDSGFVLDEDLVAGPGDLGREVVFAPVRPVVYEEVGSAAGDEALETHVDLRKDNKKVLI